jgi:hypothetical protein
MGDLRLHAVRAAVLNSGAVAISSGAAHAETLLG